MSSPDNTIYWDEKGQPVSTHFDDIYFSKEDGLAETQYVFLDNNQLEQRFAQLKTGEYHVIGETGFGTGLNFLACCELWKKTANRGAHLHFISAEKYPLNKTTIARTTTLWPRLSDSLGALLDVYPEHIPHNTVSQSGETVDVYRLTVCPSITLTLLIGDAAIGFEQLLARTLPTPDVPAFSVDNQNERYAAESRQWQGVDTWFLDGFAPAKNPEMWTDTLYTTLAKLSHSNTQLATFTAAGTVRRGLAAAGFSITKVPGFGKKREMIAAQYCGAKTTSEAPPHKLHTPHTPASPPVTKTANQQKRKENDIVHPLAPWALTARYRPATTQHTVAIIGGGLAGCHSAYALARKGYHVTLFEKNNTLASGASGNAQGIVYGKLSATCDPLGEINRYSLRYAEAFYAPFWQQSDPLTQGAACGVLQLSLSEAMQQAHQLIANNTINNPEHVNYLTSQHASHIANTRIDYPALHFPKLGWLNPSALCHWLSQQPLITVVPYTHIHQLKHHSGRWQLEGEKNVRPFTDAFDIVVIANAYDATQFTQTQHLPTKTIRGQVSHYPATEDSRHLQATVCGKGYIAPATTHKEHTIHCLGASFNLHNRDTALNENDHLQNIAHIRQQTPALFPRHDEQYQSDVTRLEGRVSFRCVTPDYLPIVGATPIIDAAKKRYSALSKNGRQVINQAGDYYPNLFVNIGYGSRGLAYAPLCSEILASSIAGTPPPIPQYLVQKLNPTRFIIRELIRNKH